MKLIVVDRAQVASFDQLSRTFAGEPNVKITWERRTRERRHRASLRGPERRSGDRRRLLKAWKGRAYIVIHTAELRPGGLLSR